MDVSITFVGTSDIADSAVTTVKIADSNVTTNKLASGERMNTTNVNGAIAGSTVGAVGTYAMLSRISTGGSPGNNEEGTTYAGSNLRYSNANGNQGNTPSGTWLLMGRIRVNDTVEAMSVSLFLRIS